MLDDFVRQANQTLNACIFECLCWTDYSADKRDSEPSYCIPFVMSLEIGVFVQAGIYMRQLHPSSDSAKKPTETPIIPSFASDDQSLKVKFSESLS